MYKPLTNIDANTLAFNNTIITIPALKTLFNNRLKELEALFFKRIICFSNTTLKNRIIDFDFNKIKDSKDNNIPLEGLLNIPYIKGIKNTILKRARDSETLIYKAVNSKKNKENSIKSYFELVNSFLKLLALNILLLSSSPLRGRAIIELKIRNSTTGSLRNVFLDSVNGLLSLDTTNINKSLNELATIDNSTIRFLLIRLSRIIIYYIVFIIPLLKYYRIIFFKLKQLDIYLFSRLLNKSIRTSDISKGLRKSIDYYFKGKLGIQEYRHLIIYIIKEKILVDKPYLLSPSKRVKESDLRSRLEPSIDDRLANHIRNIANRNYARNTNFFSNKT